MGKDDFYQSDEWLRIRYLVLRKFGFKCLACNRGARDGATIHVDHIKPRSKYPELSLNINNLQVLCGDCNSGKSDLFEDDHRVIKKGKEVIKKKKDRTYKCLPKEKRKLKAAMRMSSFIKKKLAYAEQSNNVMEACLWMKSYLSLTRTLRDLEQKGE